MRITAHFDVPIVSSPSKLLYADEAETLIAFAKAHPDCVEVSCEVGRVLMHATAHSTVDGLFTSWQAAKARSMRPTRIRSRRSMV